MANGISYLVGVDGGGTGTRVLVTDTSGIKLARGSAGPSGLINGVEFAWQSILTALNDAFASIQKPVPALHEIAIGLGLAGVHNKQWAANFIEKNPGFATVRLETDAYTTLLGAHQGQPGIIVALGTGSVGEALAKDGSRREVGGWGFPCGDEAGGAWLGMRAVNHLQQVIDGRTSGSAFSEEVFQHCGASRDAVFNWLANATQASYAKLAPIVVAHTKHKFEPAVLHIMQQASEEIVKIIYALDNTNTLPIALCGGLASTFESHLPSNISKRLVAPQGDSASGAHLLIQQAIRT